VFISKREFDSIMARLANIERAEKVGAKKNYYANQVRHIRLALIRAERRDKNTLL
jgi:hypothetical protein